MSFKVSAATHHDVRIWRPDRGALGAVPRRQRKGHVGIVVRSGRPILARDLVGSLLYDRLQPR